jgi:hypothetical protein
MANVWSQPPVAVRRRSAWPTQKEGAVEENAHENEPQPHGALLFLLIDFLDLSATASAPYCGGWTSS